MEHEKLFELTIKLNYKFNNPGLLEEALRHSSFVNEQSVDLRDNERFEFLGDAVLNLVIGHLLMQRYPDLKEGELSRNRANLVNEYQLAEVALDLNLGVYIQLGKGEIQSNGREKKSILANTLEAVIAAIYLDGGFEAAFSFVSSHFGESLNTIATSMAYNDYKSRLQELVQLTYKVVPVYHVVEESGPDHNKTFIVHLDVKGLDTEGVGKSKKMAEQDAARKALEILTKD